MALLEPDTTDLVTWTVANEARAVERLRRKLDGPRPERSRAVTRLAGAAMHCDHAEAEPVAELRRDLYRAMLIQRARIIGAMIVTLRGCALVGRQQQHDPQEQDTRCREPGDDERYHHPRASTSGL